MTSDTGSRAYSGENIRREDLPMKALLWDMDGTVVDSEPLWGIATFELGEQLGRPLTDEVRAATVGGTTANTVRLAAIHAGIDLDNAGLERWIQWMYRRVAELLSQQLPFRPGVASLLAEGRRLGLPMALVTNTSRALTEVSLDSIGRDNFDETLCGDEVPYGKPEPDIYLEAARRLDVSPQDCLVIEDSTTGMTAAYKAGCRVIGVPAEGSTHIPDFVVSLEQLRPGVTDLAGFTLAELGRLYLEADRIYSESNSRLDSGSKPGQSLAAPRHHATMDRVSEKKTFDTLFAELQRKAAERPEGSGTVQALDNGVHFQGKKIVEEAGEVWLAAEYQSDDELAEEISQLLYWLQVVMVGRGLTPDDVYKFL